MNTPVRSIVGAHGREAVGPTIHPAFDPARPAAVQVAGLTRTYGATTALAGVDLSVDPGEIYGFLGPNGAGKTTLVRILCTLLRPSGGTARVAGHDVVREPGEVRMRIGAALQDVALDPAQTGRELLALQAALFGIPNAIAGRRAAELIEMVDIGSAIDRRVATYSGGMKRRLDLALALVHGPSVLFLDEPTTGLDPLSRRQIWDEVRRLNQRDGLTVFLTTQYLEEADVLAGRVGIIAAGHLVAEGAPEDLKRSVGHDLVIVDIDGDVAAARRAAEGLPLVVRAESNGSELTLSVTDGPAAASPIAQALATLGDHARIRQLAVRRPTLDDVYLHVTGGRISSPTQEPSVAARASDGAAA